MALSLTHNPNLKTIPKSLVNLPKLEFVNLRGSSNVKFPEIFLQHYEECQDGLYYRIGSDDCPLEDEYDD